jgi:hypothetical protein
MITSRRHIEQDRILCGTFTARLLTSTPDYWADCASIVARSRRELTQSSIAEVPFLAKYLLIVCSVQIGY